MKKSTTTLDFKNLFETIPGLYLILSNDLTIVAVNDAYTRATMTIREEILGRNLFDVFPDNPDDSKADGVSKLLASLNYVLQHKSIHKMPIQKYDIRRPDGKFEERYWSPTNSPILNQENEVIYIVHQVEDVTEFAQLKKEQTQSKKDKKNLESKLSELQIELIDRYDLVNKATNEAIYDWDIERDIFYWGDGFYRNFGYSKSNKVFKLANWIKLTHPVDAEKHRQRWDEFLADKNKHRWINSFRFKCADDTYAFVEETGHLIRDLSGNPKRMVGALRNVTEAKRIEDQKEIINQITNFFKKDENLANILSQILAFFSDFGDYFIAEIWLVSNNKNYLNLLSTYSKNTAGQIFYNKSSNFKKVKYGEGIPGIIWQNQRTEVWGVSQIEKDFIRKDAAKKTNLKSVIGVPLSHNNKFVGVLLLGSQKIKEQELTNLKTLNAIGTFLGAEIKRRQQEEELNLLFYSTPDIIAVASPNGYFSKVNPAFCELMGYSEEELTSQPFSNFIHPDDLKQTEEEYNETISGERKANNFINRYKTKSGTYKWISWSSSNVFGEDSSAFAFGRDITDMKNLQQLAEDSAKLARVGSWEIDLIKNTVFWSNITKEIREAPLDFKPTLDYGISGFLEGYDRDTITQCVKNCTENGTPWDEELRIITEKGNLKWIRTIGKPEFVDGKCVRIYGSFQDIHKQKITELEIQSSLKTLEDYKFSLDQSAIIAFTDDKGRILSINDNFCKISKYSREELIGKTHKIINSNYHPKEFFLDLWKTISSGKVWRGEIKNRAKDASYYWVDTTIVPFLDQNKKPFQYLAIRFDITARKLADEKAISALKEKNNILESIGDGFFALDKNFTVSYWNRAAETLLHLPREQIIGKNLWEIFSPEIEQTSYKNYTHAMKSMEIIHFEEYYKPIEKWFEISAYPSEEGLTIFFRDVTDKKKAIEHIRISNERFEKVTEATKDAIWDWDVINDSLYWGGGYKKLFGYSIEKTNTIQSWSSNVHPDDLVRVTDSLDEILIETEKNIWETEYRYLKKDGNYAYVIDRGVIIRDHHKKAIRMIGAMTDITYHREYEESLKKLNLELEKHAKELSISNKELEQFAYVASHDLQEPLRMVSSFLTQLDKKYGEQLDEKANQYIHFAVDGAKRMRQIILDILEFSRVGKYEDKLSEINLNDLIEEIIVLQGKKIKEKKAKLFYSNLPTLTAYRSPILQVFQNLIGNALKYSREDVAPEIKIEAEELNNEWQFSISDNGIGIDEEYHEKIFVIFQRLHDKEKYGGTGMGLAIVKKIIENLGGRLWLNSTPNKGSTFYFTLKKN